MALTITEACINRDAFEPACPNAAIDQGEAIHEIDPARCTECVGHYDEPPWRMLCPVDCIPHDPAYEETRDQLMSKFHQLVAAGPAATINDPR